VSLEAPAEAGGATASNGAARGLAV
jgi:hypothetical protein